MAGSGGACAEGSMSGCARKRAVSKNEFTVLIYSNHRLILSVSFSCSRRVSRAGDLERKL
eukprot:XP_001702546.1 predicted protein [Chlamydomonas reinhardtii]